jgi:hypothetical protein
MSHDEPTGTVHLDVDVAFHRQLKAVCAFKGVSMKEYATTAIKERLEKDSDELRWGPRSKGQK